MTTKKSITTAIILVLAIADVLTIGLFWYKKSSPAARVAMDGPAEFIIKELQLNKEQELSYLGLVKEHQRAVREQRNELKRAKDDFFKLLDQPGATDSMKQAAAKRISVFTEQIDLITLQHFAKLRALCHPDQQKKLSGILKQVTHMIAEPAARRPRHGGPPPNNMPPPPFQPER